ncbi:hypothetical protein FHL15_000590 [Xylaria flabelliformis]|uniref:Uncharacterized protein n=1 Tax=Xylaria flabelliformis TaxID=2512241 RepID=A0A553IE99_9PEZI|nr:hypothetical protein FHL15_000590 [Xylaria flabelliformis]
MSPTPLERSFRNHRSMIPVPVKRESPFRSTTAPSLEPQWTKHNALIDGDITLTPQEYFNVNNRIKKTVETVLPWNYVVQGPGPRTYLLDSHLGVALVADIRIRPIKRPCSLGDPALKEKLQAMANDPKHPIFRHTYLDGKVWFYFRILDLELARLPLGDDKPD